jgi:polyisoprenyl-phosphate glycosyltransferase
MAGFAFATLSLVLIGFVIWQKIYHPELPAGWASLIATVLLIGGVQTLCIGMVGEYLGRTYLKLNNKPQFVVGNTAGFNREKHEQT